MLKNILILAPVSKYLSYWWNLGSLLGMLLVQQVISGLLLSLYYTPDTQLAFDRVQYIVREVHYGWLVKRLHFNGARILILVLYLHIVKGLFISSYRLRNVWLRGLVLWYLLSGTAFTGYVLGWSQMAYWGAVVITRLVRVIPYRGTIILQWIWGGFSVGNATLKFFFVIHFLLPWLICLLAMYHLTRLHKVGRTRILGYSGGLFKVRFWPYYWAKDLINIVPLGCAFLFILEYPNILGDPEMFVPASYLISPLHIVPEWYFLAFYSILRTVTNKTLGVIILVLRLLSFRVLCVTKHYLRPLVLLIRVVVYCFVFNFLFLLWLGQCVIEQPFIVLINISILFYFFGVVLLYIVYQGSFWLYR